jgi:hypothetical protein
MYNVIRSDFSAVKSLNEAQTGKNVFGSWINRRESTTRTRY